MRLLVSGLHRFRFYFRISHLQLFAALASRGHFKRWGGFLKLLAPPSDQEARADQ